MSYNPGMTIEGKGNGEHQNSPVGKRELRKGLPNPVTEPTAPERSCFPVDLGLSGRIVAEMTTGTGMDQQRSQNVAPVLQAIADESPALFNETFTNVIEEQAKGTEEPIIHEYLLGLTTAYSVLKEQAKANGARFPSVSQQVIDAYMQDVAEEMPNDEEVTCKAMEHVDRLTDEDPGFMLPLREYAPDPEIDAAQFSFLIAALDTYDRIKRAEISDKMIRNIGIEEAE
jgi:hypothetical protein